MSEYWPLIGQYRSHDLNSVSGWSVQITWPEYWPLIGQYRSRDLNSGSDWSVQITWSEYWPLIGLYLVTRAGMTIRARSPVWRRRAQVTLVPSTAIIRNTMEMTAQNLPGCSCRNDMSPLTIWNIGFTLKFQQKCLQSPHKVLIYSFWKPPPFLGRTWHLGGLGWMSHCPHLILAELWGKSLVIRAWLYRMENGLLSPDGWPDSVDPGKV